MAVDAPFYRTRIHAANTNPEAKSLPTFNYQQLLHLVLVVIILNASNVSTLSLTIDWSAALHRQWTRLEPQGSTSTPPPLTWPFKRSSRQASTWPDIVNMSGWRRSPIHDGESKQPFIVDAAPFSCPQLYANSTWPYSPTIILLC